MFRALRYRRAQALVIVVLSALVTTCLVLAPLYTRALEQSTVTTLLRAATPSEAGLRLGSFSSTEPGIALDPDDLADLVPSTIRGHYGTAIAATSLHVRRMPMGADPGGVLLARADACAHVRFVQGQCPTAFGEIAISMDQAKAYQQAPGTAVEVGEFDGAVSLPTASPRTTLHVVGVYDQLDSPWWFGDRLTGQASAGLGYDTMLTPLTTLTERVTGVDGKLTAWYEPHYGLDLPLRTDTVGIDQIAGLGATVADLVRYPMGVERSGTHVADTVTARSGLPAIAEQVRVGSAQAGITVPLLMAQASLLLVAVLWLVLVAAADQRRREVAVARLRGRGSRGARKILLAETLPPIIVGAPLGAALAAGAVSVARHTLLPSEPPFEVPVGALAATAAALAIMLALAVVSVRRVCREPVAALLRSVPPRRGSARLGVLEAMLVAAAAAAFVALVTGSVGGAVGQIAPTLLALAVGVIAARLLAALLAAGGRRLLHAGHPTSGAALLTASRRGTTRWLVPVVTIALCIVVVTADSLAVGARNWTERAAAEVGAATVLTLDSADLSAVTQAVRSADPTGAHVTPVAILHPAAQDATTTIGVVPTGFRHIALWPGIDSATLPWDKLTAPTTPALVATGSQISYHVVVPAVKVVGPAIRPAPTSLALALRVVRPDGSLESVPLGTIPATGIEADQTVGVSCAEGCRINGIGILAPSGAAAVSGTVTLTRLAMDGRPLDLGGATSWRAPAVVPAGSTPSGGAEVTAAFADGSITLSFDNNGADKAFLAHASVPDVVAALTTPVSTPSASAATFGGSYVDGSALLLGSVGRVAFVPGGPAAASIVNLDNLLAQGWRGRGSAVLTAYLDSADPETIATVTTALQAKGIEVVATRHAAEVATAYGQTAAAWSLKLALAVGILAILVAGVGIVVLASTARRARSRDYAALRLVGQGPRGLALLAQLETAPVILVSALLGAAVGWWAAPSAVSMMPLFPTPSATFPVDLHTALGPALVASLGGLLVLTLVGVVTSHTAARRADLQQLREAG